MKMKWRCQNCGTMGEIDFDPIVKRSEWDSLSCVKCGEVINPGGGDEWLGYGDEKDEIVPVDRTGERSGRCPDHKKKRTMLCAECERLSIEKIRKELGMTPLKKDKEYKDYLNDAKERGEKDSAYFKRTRKRKGVKPVSYEEMMEEEFKVNDL